MSETEWRERLEVLLDPDLPPASTPEQRLLLAILNQAVMDYFDEDPVERVSAALYFAHSPLYQLTLSLFDLPHDLLPAGVERDAFSKDEMMNAERDSEALRLETLVRRLSGTQLKVVLTMGLLPLPTTTRKISMNCGMTRSTVLQTLEQLLIQGLVERRDGGAWPLWSLPAAVQNVLDEMWR